MRQTWAKALALILILNFNPFFYSSVSAARYVDMTGNWAERYVNQLSDKEILPPEKDGKFHPTDKITRAVLSTWLVKTLGLQNQVVTNKTTFSDVKSSDWFYKAVELVVQNNYIAGYNDGFRPNQFIQRGEVITILARTLPTADPDETTIAKELAKYKDGSKVPDWARAGVAKVSLAGVLINHPDPQIINAASLATRADTAVLLYQLDEFNTKRAIAEANKNTNTQKAVMSQGQTMNAPYTPYNASLPIGQPAMAQNYNSGGGYAQGQYGQYSQPTNRNYQPAQNQYQNPQQNWNNNSQQPQQPQQSYGGGYPAQGGYAPGTQQGSYLQGRLAVVEAGTHFHATLVNTLDSGSTQPGEQVTATLSEPLYANGQEVVPAGSTLTGQVTKVLSAKRFRFGNNGQIEVKFTTLTTPDGRRFPLSASIDSNQVNLSGGTTKGRIGKSALATGIGAGGGAALGTGLGAITGGLSGSRNEGMSVGMGAVFGTAIGSVVGLGVAGVRKGSEVKLPANMSLPVKLDEALQISGGPPAYSQPSQYGGGGYGQPPVQQPAGQYYPR